MLGGIQKNHHEINYSTIFTSAISPFLELTSDAQQRGTQINGKVFTYSE
jgi:hypothetical protein